MKVYKRSLFQTLRGFLLGPISAFAIVYVLTIFDVNFLVRIAAGILVMLVVLYFTFYSDQIRFEITKDQHLRYYEKFRICKDFKLQDCEVGYRRSWANSSQDVLLQIIKRDGTEEFIDCSALGINTFLDMYQHLKAIAGEHVHEMK